MNISPKQVTLFGATGQVGQVVLREALQAGYQVKALVRSPEKLGALREDVEVVEGDLLDGAAIAQALQGSEAVLNAAGGVKEPDQHARFHRIGHTLLDAMKQRDITRLVSLSGAVTALPGEKLDLQRRLMRVMVGLFFREMKQAQDAIMSVISNDQDVAWTFVRPAVFSTAPATGAVLADAHKLPALKITIEDLGRFMVEQVESTAWVRQAPLVASGKV